MHGKFKGFIKDNGDEFENDGWFFLSIGIMAPPSLSLKTIFSVFNYF